MGFLLSETIKKVNLITGKRTQNPLKKLDGQNGQKLRDFNGILFMGMTQPWIRGWIFMLPCFFANIFGRKDKSLDVKIFEKCAYFGF